MKRPRALFLKDNSTNDFDDNDANKIRKSNTNTNNNTKSIRDKSGSVLLTETTTLLKKDIDTNAELKNLKLELALKEAELERGRNEIKRAMNKYDARMILYEERVKKELETRRAWKAREDSLILEKEQLTRENEQLKSAVTSKDDFGNDCHSLLNELRPSADALLKLVKFLKKSDTTANTETANTQKYIVSESDLMKAPFCVVCQAHTADMIIVECGHVCLCFNHAQQMLHNNQLKQCPVCLQKCSSICQLQGLSKIDTQELQE